jgi:formylglycine-generating enzyme required for sulfatase activity
MAKKETPPPIKQEPLPTTFKNSIGMEFVIVPKGKSWLGGINGKEGTKEVNIAVDIYLGVYEVTQEEWQKIMGNNPSYFNRARVNNNIGDDELKRFPVELVSWHDAKHFVKLVNDRVKNDAQEAGWEYRLPMQEQWEYACRGGPMTDEAESAFDYYFEKPSKSLSADQANFNENVKQPSKVGSYPPNRLGLYDMHGNVWEWCEDWIDPEFARLVRPSVKGLDRVARGGSWGMDAANNRAFYPYLHPASFRFRDLGLRLARVPLGAP